MDSRTLVLLDRARVCRLGPDLTSGLHGSKEEVLRVLALQVADAFIADADSSENSSHVRLAATRVRAAASSESDACLDAALLHLAEGASSAGSPTETSRLDALEVLIAQLQTASLIAKRRVEAVAESLSSAETSKALVARGSLDALQISMLHDINAALLEEYTIRRRMLTERAKVTLKALKWSGRLAEKGTEKEVETMVDIINLGMVESPSVNVENVFSMCRGDIVSAMERSVHASSAFGTSLRSLLIGSVPDRGGRDLESRAKESRMPEWATRRAHSGVASSNISAAAAEGDGQGGSSLSAGGLPVSGRYGGKSKAQALAHQAQGDMQQGQVHRSAREQEQKQARVQEQGHAPMLDQVQGQRQDKTRGQAHAQARGQAQAQMRQEQGQKKGQGQAQELRPSLMTIPGQGLAQALAPVHAQGQQKAQVLGQAQEMRQDHVLGQGHTLAQVQAPTQQGQGGGVDASRRPQSGVHGRGRGRGA